jgi:hypothetical protein
MSTKWTCENRPKGRHNDGNLTARALRFLARAHSLLPASSKTLVTVRAFQMLRVHLRSLCGRDAVATMRAIDVEDARSVSRSYLLRRGILYQSSSHKGG